MKKQTYGFGVDPAQNQNHFYVWILPKKIKIPHDVGVPRSDFADSSGLGSSAVQVFERLTWPSGDEEQIRQADRLRIVISKHKWGEVKDALVAEFNFRLKKERLKIGKFAANGGTPVERLFGKELMVLLWAIEDSDPSVISTAVRNWKGLMPEERWWLYTMTNAATGEINDRKGWRKALRFALCENPVVERGQMSLLDAL